MDKTKSKNDKNSPSPITIDNNPIFFFCFTILLFHSIGISIPYENQLIQITKFLSWVLISILTVVLICFSLLLLGLTKMENKSIRKTRFDLEEENKSPQIIWTIHLYSLLLSYVDPMGGFCLVTVFVALISKIQETHLLFTIYQAIIPRKLN